MADKATKPVKDAASDAASEAADDAIDEMRAEVERLTKALEEAKAMLGKDAEDVLDDIGDTAEEWKERMQEGFNDLQKQIHDNPLPAAFAAFIIGLVLGRVIAR